MEMIELTTDNIEDLEENMETILVKKYTLHSSQSFWLSIREPEIHKGNVLLSSLSSLNLASDVSIICPAKC